MSERATVERISVEGLTFAYGDSRAVDGVSFEAKAGDLLAIVGPNGCGKSTLLRLMVGELKAASGRWRMDGKIAAEFSRAAMARHVALVPQMVFAPFGYTVSEMVLMGRHAAHASGSLMAVGFETLDDFQRADAAMWTADVHHLADRPIDQLSGGERQRVAIARALTQDTPVLLLDEPASNLDLYHQLELLAELRRLTEQERRIALMVTHDLNAAASCATRVVLMDRGKVAAAGATADVLTAETLEPVYQVRVQRTANGRLDFSRLSPQLAPSRPSA